MQTPPVDRILTEQDTEAPHWRLNRKKMDKPKKLFKKNLKKAEFQAIMQLQDNHSIILMPGDKGGK